MKTIKKLLKYKTADKFIKIALSVMLIFTVLISPAVSYQQAMTATSENTYTIGEGVSATLNIQTDTKTSDKKIYPNEYIQMTPIVTNTGVSPIWTVLAIKVPSMKNVFTPYKSNQWLNIDGAVHFDEVKYYPAFYTVPSGDTGYVRDYTYGVTNSDYNMDLLAQLPDTPWSQKCAEGWTLLEINQDYANKDNGFFIYYFGYNTLLNRQESITPFEGVMAANFQEIVHGGISWKEVKRYKSSETSENIGLEMRLFAVQAGTTATILETWDNAHSKFSVFGNTSILNNTVKSEYSKGRHEITLYITKDIQQIKIINKNSNVSEIYDLDESPYVTSVSASDSNGVRIITLNANFDSSGVYEAVVSSDKSEFVNPVNLGYVKVTQ